MQTSRDYLLCRKKRITRKNKIYLLIEKEKKNVFGNRNLVGGSNSRSTTTVRNINKK